MNRGGLARYKWLTLPITVAASVVMLLFFFEGVFSALWVLHDWRTSQSRRSAREPDVEYDAHLGWAGRPNLRDPNYFGPGLALTTDARGFRESLKTSAAGPTGTIRVACSGDSFTFGEGVRDDATWCAALEALDARLETVNLAQSGYGADQAYLRYQREGGMLDARLHLFAFVTDDFSRMELRAIAGTPKPTLRLAGGRLFADPVPRPPGGSSDDNSLLAKLGNFRTVWFFQHVAAARRERPRADFGHGPAAEESTVLRAMWRDLDDWAQRDRGEVVLVYLPSEEHDYERDSVAVAWRRLCREQAGDLGIPFVDLVDKFDALPITAREGMFIHSMAQDLGDTGGHYDDQGNAWVASELMERLSGIQGVQALLPRIPR